MANQPDVPEEIQDYYQTERRERTGIAWLLAFGTLIITIVLGAGIFFAGRWAYRQIAGTDESTGTPTEIVQNEEQEPASDTNDRNEQSGEQGGQGSGSVQSNEDENHSEETGEETDESSQQEESDTAPATGSVSDENLPDTGAGSTVAVFMAVSLLGYLIHRFRLWRILKA